MIQHFLYVALASVSILNKFLGKFKVINGQCQPPCLLSPGKYLAVEGRGAFQQAREVSVHVCLLTSFHSFLHLSVPGTRALSGILGTLRNDYGDGNRNVKKAIGLMSKTTTLHVHHAFLYISLPSLHNYDVND